MILFYLGYKSKVMTEILKLITLLIVLNIIDYIVNKFKSIAITMGTW